MSILQISPHENISSIMHSLLKAKPADIEWPHYAQLAEQQEDSEEKILNRKRATARKFLRAGESEKSYRKDASSVFTPQFVKDLGNSNAARRSRRNPWLASRASGEPGNESASASVNENVLPFGPQVVAQNNKTADLPV